MDPTPTASAPAEPQLPENSPASLAEQLRWVESELDSAVAASGIREGWFAAFGEIEIPWDNSPENRVEILGSLLPQHCPEGGQLVQDLVVLHPAQALTAAAGVRAEWVRAGWAVSDVRDAPETAELYLRADRDDGAVLSLDADATGLILRVSSACSSDRSVIDPTADLSERDSFLEALRSREPQ